VIVCMCFSMDMPFVSMPPSASTLADHIVPPTTTVEDDDALPTLPRSSFDPVTTIMSQIVQQMSGGKIVRLFYFYQKTLNVN